MQHITKLCADRLRAFTNDNYGVKLKASHAHELVSAFFGYQSRAALLADTKYPLSNLHQAEFVVLVPPTGLAEQRRKELQGLSFSTPAASILAEGVYSALLADKSILDKVWPTFEDLAVFLADKHASQLLSWKTDPKPVHENVTVEVMNEKVLMTVSRTYKESSARSFLSVSNDKNVATTIKIPRVVANIGFGKPDISRTIEVDTNVKV